MINAIIMGTIIVYLCLLIGVGVYNGKKNSNTEDFYLGGRRMGPLVVAMSAEASDMSSWLLMGLPGVAYATGLADPFWTAAGLALGTYFNWLLVSRRLRRYSYKVDAITVPSFLAKRFRDKKNIITALAALVIVIFFIPYTASGFAACGKLFHSLFGIPYMTGVLVFAVVIVVYTIIGGFSTVATNDFIQSVVMSVALISITLYGVTHAGGFGAVIDNAKALPGYLNLNQSFDAVAGAAVEYPALKSASMLAWGFGYFGMPHILVRFMSIEDEKKLKLSRRIGSIWVVIAMTVAVFIGIVGLGMTNAGAMESLEDSETVIVVIARMLSQHGALPAILGGVILAGILAATMSTADSQLLVAASGVSENIIQDFMGIKLSEKKSLSIARITILVISVVGVFLARDPNSSVFGIVSFAWAGFGGSFGATMICALFWKRTTLQGALAGMVAGGATVFIWKYAVAPMGGLLNIYELLPAFFVSLAFVIVVSLLTKAPEREIIDEFEYARAKSE